MAAKQKRVDNIVMRNKKMTDKRKGVGKAKNKVKPGFEGKLFGKGVLGAQRCFAFCYRVFECNNSFLNHDC